jgi:hypothetical protein
MLKTRARNIAETGCSFPPSGGGHTAESLSFFKVLNIMLSWLLEYWATDKVKKINSEGPNQLLLPTGKGKGKMDGNTKHET